MRAHIPHLSKQCSAASMIFLLSWKWLLYGVSSIHTGSTVLSLYIRLAIDPAFNKIGVLETPKCKLREHGSRVEGKTALPTLVFSLILRSPVFMHPLTSDTAHCSSFVGPMRPCYTIIFVCRPNIAACFGLRHMRTSRGHGVTFVPSTEYAHADIARFALFGRQPPASGEDLWLVLLNELTITLSLNLTSTRGVRDSRYGDVQWRT